jgi:hypothetical protein
MLLLCCNTIDGHTEVYYEHSVTYKIQIVLWIVSED